MSKYLVWLFVLFSCESYAEEMTFESAKSDKVYSTGFVLKQGWSKDVVFGHAKMRSVALPRNFDWRSQVTLSPIKDQLSCGSCWSFSTVATLQDSVAVREKKILNFSEQYLLDCNKEGFSCKGGFFAHDYHVRPRGGVDGATYPYQNVQGSCKSGLAYKNSLESWAYIPSVDENTPPSVEAIKQAIYEYGPISVGVAVDKNFTDYKSGIFNNCTATTPNHAVNLVGWNDDGQYWIMRNSWSSSKFGEQGWMRIKYNCNKIGIAANYVVYKSGNVPPPNPNPTPNPKPTPTCEPQPYANAGKSVSLRRFQSAILGTPGKPGTTYHWESSLRQGVIWNGPQLKIMAMTTQTFTVYATTKCGTAKSSATVKVVF